jgi:hypothetical protein
MWNNLRRVKVSQGFVVLGNEHHFPINDEDIPVPVNTINKAQAGDLFPLAWLAPYKVC